MTIHAAILSNGATIPVRGKHLDEFGAMDYLFVGCSKASSPLFMYLFMRYAFSEPQVSWCFEFNVDVLRWDVWLQLWIAPILSFFVIYDFFYTILHGILHIPGIYGYIHKHHHQQKAPSRGNLDAINVHPVEFFLGEYNHWWSVFLYCRGLGAPVHIGAILLFLVLGGYITTINHCRHDISLSIPHWKAIWNLEPAGSAAATGCNNADGSLSPSSRGNVVVLFDSKDHDVHHRLPRSNYGQYTMLWDRLFGTHRPYNPRDRVNPKAQLNPQTNKSYEYEEQRRKEKAL
jgi:sterol desaturase/sphingolipid hydroxylase (fatty acid hydroxylase superfamily)